jgi:hypothetical protein
MQLSVHSVSCNATYGESNSKPHISLFLERFPLPTLPGAHSSLASSDAVATARKSGRASSETDVARVRLDEVAGS